jgi:hypothetical protein
LKKELRKLRPGKVKEPMLDITNCLLSLPKVGAPFCVAQYTQRNLV